VLSTHHIVISSSTLETNPFKAQKRNLLSITRTDQRFLGNRLTMSRLLNARGTCPTGDEDIRDAQDRLAQEQSLRFTQVETEDYLNQGTVEGIAEENAAPKPGRIGRLDGAVGQSDSKEALELERADVMATGLQGLNLGEYWNAFASAFHADLI
jgi:hypothetical protein